jgi:hypothetical protein
VPILMGRNPPALELYSSCALRAERCLIVPLYPLGRVISTQRYVGKTKFAGKLLFDTR